MEADDEKGQSGALGRLRDPAWDLFTVAQVPGRGKPSGAFCKLCVKSVSPKIERLRAHLERFHPDVMMKKIYGPELDEESSQGASNPCLDRTASKVEFGIMSELDQDSSSSFPKTNEVLPELNFVIKHDIKAFHNQEMNEDVQPETETIMDSESVDLEIPEERDLILKYFVATESEAEVKCNLCDHRMFPETTELIDHLFDFHTSTIDMISKELGLEKAESQGSSHSKDKGSFQLSESGKLRTSVWNNFDKVIVEFEDKSVLPKVKCKLCQQIVSQKVERLRRHMVRFHPDAVDKETEERFLSSKEAQELSSRWGNGVRIPKIPKLDTKLKLDGSETKHEGKKSTIWSYYEVTRATNAAKAISTICKLCHRNVSPKIERLRRHFVTFHPHIVVTDGTVLETELPTPPGPSSVPAQGASRKWIWKYFDMREEDEKRMNGKEAQCRLCHDLYDPEPNSLHQHLKNTHPGILEFCDDEHGGSSIANEERSFEVVNDRRKFRNSKRNNGKCLLCRHEVFGLSNASSCSFQSWDADCAKSLCEVFLLEDSYCEYFEAGKYCKSCQALVRNIDFTQRALKKLNTLLASYRASYENLLRKEYSRLALGSHSRDSRTDTRILDKLHDGIINRSIRTLRTTSDTPRDTEKRRLRKERSPGYKFKVTREPSEKTPPKVIQYTSKYGRASTRMSFIESDSDAGTENGSEILGGREQPELEEDGTSRSTNETPDINSSTVDSSLLQRSKRNLPGQILWKHGFGKEKSCNDTSILKATAPINPQKLLCKEAGCNFSCYRKLWLDVHVRSRHENDDTPYHCECGEKFGSMTTYAYHQRRHGGGAGEKLHRCLRCDKTFCERRTLRQHWNKVHLKLLPPLEVSKCPFCSLEGEDDQLTEHEKLHDVKTAERVPYACVLCDSQVYTNSVDLRTHVKHVHNPSSTDLKCDKCQKVFRSKAILRRHRQSAHSERPLTLECGECGTVSENRADHLRHLRRQHQIGRPFLCAECGTTFKTKSSLRVHTMLHTGEKPWRCKLCPKGFNQTSKLKAHEETHVSTKSYVCDKCGKAFRTARNIYQHRRFHCHPESVKGDPKTRQRRKESESDEESGSSTSLREEGEGHQEGRVAQGHDGIPFTSGSNNSIPVWIHEEQELATLGLVGNE